MSCLSKLNAFGIDERGATTIEQAIVLAVYLPLILLSTSFTVLLYNQISLQYAVTEASRMAVVTPGTNVRTVIANRMSKFGLPLTDSDTVIACPASQLSTCKNDPHRPTINNMVQGQPEQPMVFEAYRTLRVFSYGLINISARVYAKNEPPM